MSDGGSEARSRSGGASSDRIHDAAFAEIARDGLGGVALDFGAGRGDFAARLVATGRFDHVYAADLVRFVDPPAGVQWIDADLNEPLPLPDDSCDLIAAIEVVEHLENIRAVCREWARLLRPGGRVVLTTPNNESLRSVLSLFFRGHFIAFVGDTYPAHITALLRSDLERALAEAGLRTERFFYTDEGAIPRLTRVTWQSGQRRKASWPALLRQPWLCRATRRRLMRSIFSKPRVRLSATAGAPASPVRTGSTSNRDGHAAGLGRRDRGRSAGDDRELDLPDGRLRPRRGRGYLAPHRPGRMSPWISAPTSAP